MNNAAATGKRILIVDDSIEYLHFMQLLLDAEGFEAQIAPTTAAMREVVQRRPPDLVISDVRLPDDGPFAVLDLLRADEATCRIPVLLCTGAVQEVEERADRLQRDGVDVLFKPFDIDVLLEHVSRLCGLQAPV